MNRLNNLNSAPRNLRMILKLIKAFFFIVTLYFFNRKVRGFASIKIEHILAENIFMMYFVCSLTGGENYIDTNNKNTHNYK